MMFELLQDGKVLYHTSFPICRITQDVGIPNRTVTFYVPGGHTFQGERHTGSSQRIEGNIWQAGTEATGMLLGVSFSTKNQLLLNTIHFATASGESSTKIDQRLITRTIVKNEP
jgi:hypothetical protein